METHSGWRASVAAAVGLAAVCVLAPRDPANAPREPQVAVLGAGFVATLPGATEHRVFELDEHGGVRARKLLAHAGDVRVVGTSAGAMAAWIEGKQFVLTRVSDGKQIAAWGKDVRRLCDGVASNDDRFGMGFLEADGGVWFVAGATSRAATAGAIAAPPRASWCGLASAGPNIALLWRERDRLYVTLCPENGCTGLVATLAIAEDVAILGFGCTRNACLVAVRPRGGQALLAFVTQTGEVKWRKPLPTTVPEVSIVGIGDKAFAVGFAGDRVPEVWRIARGGKAEVAWRSARAGNVPQLAWAHDRLLLAQRVGDHEVVAQTLTLREDRRAGPGSRRAAGSSRIRRRARFDRRATARDRAAARRR